MSRSVAPNTHLTGIYRREVLNIRIPDILKRHPMKESALNVNAADIATLSYLLDPDDWLGRRPRMCLALIAIATFVVGALQRCVS